MGNKEVCCFCGGIIDWDDGDEEHGLLWECEACHRTFCRKCFVEQYGYSAYLEMTSAENDTICCPECYANKKGDD